jgi:hypothetical protein
VSDTLTDPLPPLKPAEKHARLETDTFCLECGYNLHSQAVVRDERLGIFVCRCPECGRYHPAGIGVTATRTWLNRFATILLFFWILIILSALFWIAVGFGAIQVAFVEDFTYREMLAPDGREVAWGNSGAFYTGTTQPATTWTYVYTLNPSAGEHRRPWLKWEALFFAIGGAALGFVSGALLIVFFWHWKKRRYAWPMLLPLAIAAVVSAIFAVNDEYKLILPWAVRAAFGWAMWEMAWTGVGVVLGRKLARVLLRMFIPPRPRQHFAFLWSADGKVMPPARTLAS